MKRNTNSPRYGQPVRVGDLIPEVLDVYSRAKGKHGKQPKQPQATQKELFPGSSLPPRQSPFLDH